MKGEKGVFLDFSALYFHYIFCYLGTKSHMQLQYMLYRNTVFPRSLSSEKTEAGSWQSLLRITVGSKGDIEGRMLQVYACVYL